MLLDQLSYREAMAQIKASESIIAEVSNPAEIDVARRHAAESAFYGQMRNILNEMASESKDQSDDPSENPTFVSLEISPNEPNTPSNEP